MKMSATFFAICLLNVATSTRVAAQTVPVPSDIAFTLSGAPTAGLDAGQPIILTLTVSNLGPATVDRLQIASSFIYDDVIDLSDAESDCAVMILTVVDTQTGYFYYYSWYPTDVAPLAVGETRSCQLRLALASTAPRTVSFSFGLPKYYVDLNPDNDIGTVTLQRAGVASAVPTLSVGTLILFGLLLTGTGMACVDGRWSRNPFQYGGR